VAYGSIQHAFIWSPEDGMKDLGVLPGFTHSVATAINRQGEVVGFSTTPDLVAHSFRWTPETGMVDLGVSSGCVSFRASGINSDGDIVGQCVRDRSTTVYRPFRWTKSRGMEDLGTYFGDKEGGASAINDRGEIVGFSSRESYYDDSRAVMWTRVGNAAQLGNCAQDGCSANGAAINSHGDVAGSFEGHSALWWAGGSFVQLAAGADSEYGTATGINDRGQVVGVIYPPDGPAPIRAYFWAAYTGVVSIQGPAGASETFVSGINNNGDIVGYSR
jgi:probable HAF family extracellular repeat protein